jgi:Ca2+-binding EF-hand superfamily protein
MELTDEEAKARLEREDNLVNLLIEHRTKHDGKGRREGDNNIPKELRTLMALTVGESKSQREVAQLFGVSDASVSNVSNGKISHDRSDKALTDIKVKREEKASEKALDNLFELLDATKSRITASTKLREIASAAKDMATVHEKLSGHRREGNQANILIYAPRLVKEENFEVIEVEAQVVER